MINEQDILNGLIDARRTGNGVILYVHDLNDETDKCILSLDSKGLISKTEKDDTWPNRYTGIDGVSRGRILSEKSIKKAEKDTQIKIKLPKLITA